LVLSCPNIDVFFNPARSVMPTIAFELNKDQPSVDESLP
jgi:hypothetical protein